MDIGPRLVASGNGRWGETVRPERWQRVKQVLDGALALQDNHRSSYLEQACANDAELRHEVESLLVQE